MGEQSGKQSTSKPLSAHQAGQFAPHGKPLYNPDGPEEVTEPLTVKEEQVLSLVAEDTKDADIAGELNMAKAPVEKHLERIYSKLSVKSRASAAIWYLKRQLAERDKQIVILKQLLAETGGSSAASSS